MLRNVRRLMFWPVSFSSVVFPLISVFTIKKNWADGCGTEAGVFTSNFPHPKRGLLFGAVGGGDGKAEFGAFAFFGLDGDNSAMEADKFFAYEESQPGAFFVAGAGVR